VRDGAGPGGRGGSCLAHGRRHGARAGRAARAAGGPQPVPGPPARAGRQPGALDRRAGAPDEHPARQATRQQGRAPGGRDRGLPANPFCIVRFHPRGRRRVPAAGPAAGRLLPVERRLRVHHPAAARQHRPALPGQRRHAQDGNVLLGGDRARGALLLRGPEQDLDAQGPLAARPCRACPLRGFDAAPLGPHLREVTRPGHARAVARQRRRRRGGDEPAANRRGACGRRPDGAQRSSGRRRPARRPAPG
jgi:hypothetical protein